MNPTDSSQPKMQPQSQSKRLLSLGTDRLLFEEGSSVRDRILGYARDWDEIHIIVSADKNFTETAIGNNVWIYPTRSKVKAFYPLHMRNLGRFIIKRRNITNITCQDPFLTAIAGVGLKKEFGLPLEIQVHTDIGSPNYPRTVGNKIRKALALSYLPKADSIRVVSGRVKKYLVEGLAISESKITVRPIAVDVEKIKNTPVTVDLRKKYPQFDKIILMASRLTEEKNIGLALRALPAVLRLCPKAGLVIVGRGPKETELKKLTQKLGLAESVVFEDWIDPATLVSYYKTSDLFLNTSLFEGYGMTLVEAKAAGCMIVSTDVGVARDIGTRIIPDDSDGAASVICDMLK
ncbi:MAG: glycosyltransferase [Candidatus Taylorbacteria bacterium]|nr:glycosyltransferase [Candidatus Taylorbacteria bacterium]